MNTRSAASRLEAFATEANRGHSSSTWELRRKRASVVEQMQGILTAAESANADLTNAQAADWRRLEGEADSLTREIASQEVRDTRSRRAAAGAGSIDGANDELEERALEFFRGGAERSIEIDVRDAAALHNERRDLVVGTASAGGNTVPVGFANKLYEHLVQTSPLRQTNVSVVTTSSGEDLRIPKTTAHGTAAIVAEGANFPESDPTIGQVTLQAFKYGVLIQVSTELITDTAVDLLGYLARQAGRAIGIAQGTHFITGDGSSKPQGITTVSTLGKTAASATAITADELIDLYWSVIPEYQARGSWLMAGATWASIRKLKAAGTGEYLVDHIAQTGAPQLLGRPVFIDPNMPAMTTGLKSVIFGDLSAYYIRDVGAVAFDRSDDFAFNADLVTFRARLRSDGDLIDTTGAVKHLIQA